MDDFVISSLHESKNEWGSRLLTILTPLVTEGVRSIFNEAVDLCKSNGEMDKYLMTFQNFITRIPKWNSSIIETEKKRIVDRSGCGYLEDLITCVHIIQLKLLTAIRVGQKQRKIDVNIPKLGEFIHSVYIHVARKIYKNVYLFELGIPPLQIQKNQRELEIIIQECILNTVRESIPVETILRAYMDETVEEDVTEEIKEEIIEPEVPIQKAGEKTAEVISEIKPTSIPQLESHEIQVIRKEEEQFPELENTILSNNELIPDILKEEPVYHHVETKPVFNEERVNILDQPATIDNLDIHVIDPPFPDLNLNDDFLLNDIEILE